MRSPTRGVVESLSGRRARVGWSKLVGFVLCSALLLTASCTASSYVKPFAVVIAMTGAIASFTAMRSDSACTSWRSSRVHSLVWRVISWRSPPPGRTA